MNDVKGITVRVSGMTCSHCEASVKRNLEALPGIDEVMADNRSGSVKITGKDINTDKIREIITGLGYKYLG